MKLLSRSIFCLLALLPAGAFAQTTLDVGSGAPNEAVRQMFVNAYFRNGFSNLVLPTPAGNVTKLGTTGYYQLFTDASTTSLRYALIKANDSAALGANVYQMYSLMYTYFNSVGVNTAGYPTMDTNICYAGSNPCFYQFFDKNYALFVYQTATLNGQNFATRDPYYTVWKNFGGMTAMGAATSAETATTSTFKTTGTVQYYASGMLANLTSGTQSGKLFSVQRPVYDYYVSLGGPTGTLGFPQGEPLQTSATGRRQTFEGGSVDYDINSGILALRSPVSTINLSPGQQTVKLNLNDTYQVSAINFDAQGNTISGRAVQWTNSNGRVVSIQSDGQNATVKAIGGGTAVVSATSEGKLSLPITFFVTSPCCAVGEGAPNATIAQAFTDAVTRRRLNLKLPGQSPVTRVGGGYQQTFFDATAGTTRYVIALPDSSPLAYVLTGAILVRYESAGGATAALGYPLSDASDAGRQTFEKGALAGSPVHIVSGNILTKWAIMNYETGAAGLPTSETASFFTFAATSGISQTFANGIFYAMQSGVSNGKVFFVSGPVLARYSALGGITGKFGAPLNDEFGINGKRHQDFEAGYFEYTPGDAVARETENARKAVVSALPASPIAGSRVRISVGGFDTGATLRVSMTGAPDFLVTTQNGAYAWDLFIPVNAAVATTTITVKDANGSASAQTSYTVRTAASAKLQLAKTGGDSQTGSPGTVVAQPLTVTLRDETGIPLSGATVTFQPSPGATVAPLTAVTDVNGQASTSFRLPASEGIALATASAGQQIVTFSARAVANSIGNVPKFTSAADPLLASAASIIRYHQSRADIGTPNGQADVAPLEAFLQNFCVFDAQGQQICDGYVAVPGQNAAVANLWRLAGFVSGNLSVSIGAASIGGVVDAIAVGEPAIVGLQLNTGAPHYVVAVGTASDGSILIQDPNPTFARTNLNDYLAGFSVGGVNYKAAIVSVVQLFPKPPSSNGFLVTMQNATIDINSPAGVCGATLKLPVDAMNLVAFRFCDGAQSFYQVDVKSAADYAGAVTDLGAPGATVPITGARAGSFKVTRPGLQWTTAALDLSFSTSSVVNAANFGLDFAPGGLIAIFGTGLGRGGAATTVTIGGQNAPVIFATPFQVNAQVPFGLKPGSYLLGASSVFGSLEQQVDIRELAPALFKLDANRGAIVNQDGTINSSTSPARRGQVALVYGTGFGEVVKQGSLSVTAKPVTAQINGVDVPVAFAGLAPGFIGLYQLNLQLPAGMPPGLDVTLSIKQGGVASNPVTISVQ
jgi:uncharacterized protein (TIGR03437 family)